jgi:uncharacterized oxidoreductase
MKKGGNTVLITGGATGIGLELARAFIEAGSEVIACARTEENLNQAKDHLPKLHVKKCDVSKEAEREALYEWTISNFKNLNIFVNNAGIQRMIDFKKGLVDLLEHEFFFDSSFNPTALFAPATTSHPALNKIGVHEWSQKLTVGG